MKQKLTRLSQGYAGALRTHLAAGPNASLVPALRLGRRAVALGLETLEMARIHEQAVAGQPPATRKDRMVKRAERFFIEAIGPIVETHRAGQRTQRELDRLNLALTHRTRELVTSNRELQRGTARRKSVEAALEKSGEHYARLLKESLHLQQGLRQLTHQLLAAQEEERRQISLELQNEIAQTLLGINVRLLSLKSQASSNSQDLKQEIASTRQLVIQSARSVGRRPR